MIQIRSFADVAHRADICAAIDRIFFENAATPDFSGEEERRNYRALWLDRYLQNFPESCWIAFDDNGDGDITGYLAGSLVSDRSPLPGPDYYRLFPDNFVEKYPAHMHVNVRSDRQGQGIGRELIDAFRAHCREKELAGFHAVTAANRCPAHFFTRCGMAVQARVLWHNSWIVFIAEHLAS